jgi:hypothetical protein
MVALMACSTSCPTQDCESYGACLRRKGIQIDTYSLQFGAVALEKRKDETLARFKACVEAGVTPAAPLRTDVAKAEAILNTKGK